MVPAELLKQVRLIQLRTKNVVSDLFAGEYVSAFKGRGMEFEEVREYVPGDEVRNIDWNVTARTGVPYIKNFREERELTIMFVVDTSASTAFSSRDQTRLDLAAEVCAVLAFTALRSNDKVGLIRFANEDSVSFVPPRKGLRHALRMVRDLLATEATRAKADFANALHVLDRVTPRRSIAFLLSDFLFDHPTDWDNFRRAMAVASRRHDMIGISLSDPLEESWPNVGLIELQNPETGEIFVMDTFSKRARRQFAEWRLNQAEMLDKSLRRAGADHIPLKTNEPYASTLVNFFRRREQRR